MTTGTTDLAPAWFLPAMQETLHPINERLDALSDQVNALRDQFNILDERVLETQRLTRVVSIHFASRS